MACRTNRPAFLGPRFRASVPLVRAIRFTVFLNFLIWKTSSPLIKFLNSLVQVSLNITAPPKSYLEEKMLFALFWNRNLQSFWHRELGGRFVERLEKVIPNDMVDRPHPSASAGCHFPN